MENKKEPFSKKKQTFSREKVVVAIMMAIAILGVGTYLIWSKSARGFLRQSGAIAIKSFEDVLAPSAPDAIVSEIDRASPGVPSAADEKSGETSSVADRASAEGGGSFSGNGIAAAGRAMIKSRNDHETNATSAASTPPPIVENSSADISASDANESTDAGSPAVATENESAINCPFPVSVPTVISHRVIINEIAWMGLPSSTDETAERAANGEWMELKNISGEPVALDGWKIVDASEKIKILFGSGDALTAHGLYLLSRGGSSVNGISADKAYAGILPNDGDKLAVLDEACGASDFLDASSKWPGGSNATKQTLERRMDLGWQTSATAGGTPRVENSAGVAIAPATGSSTEKYAVSVMMVGNGDGKVTIKPNGVTCKTSCANEYTEGTTVTLTAIPDSGARFVGWSGGCSGAAGCSFVVDGPVSVMVGFHLDAQALSTVANDVDMLAAENGPSVAISSSSSDDASTTSGSSLSGDTESETLSSSTPTTSSTPPVVAPTDTAPFAAPTINHLVLAAIQIAGATTDDDFVKIYNPTPGTVDMSGWKLRKKSSTGTDSSLREFPKGSTITPAGYFTWASSANGFAQSTHADASSTGTLAANNSVALFDGNGTQVDAVAWGTGANQYVEGAAYPDSPPVNQTLQRKFADGAVVDTDNNKDDFTL